MNQCISREDCCKAMFDCKPKSGLGLVVVTDLSVMLVVAKVARQLRTEWVCDMVLVKNTDLITCSLLF